VKFTPHVVTLQCPECVFDSYDIEDVLFPQNKTKQLASRECLSNGLYCLMPPKTHVHRDFNVTDAALLTEDLYGRCFHEVT